MVIGGAVISDCGNYRYVLERRWGEGLRATFIMLNPSTADASEDDPTIRRCVGFAKTWGCGALSVVNLYALRATDPSALWAADDPVGPENDRYLKEAAEWARGPLVAAWGVNARPYRISKVLELTPAMGRLQALGVTKSGQPRHPLYMKSDSSLSPWPVAS